MIRFKVVRGCDLAVGAAALILLAVLAALFFSGGDQAVSAPLEISAPQQQDLGVGSVFAHFVAPPEDLAVRAAMALPAFASSAGGMFSPSGLPVPGEALRPTGEFLQPALPVGEIAERTSPRVLIYHTHTHEAYRMAEPGLYQESEPWRTADERYNVVRVGAELAAALRQAGIDAFQDPSDHEGSDLGGAYERSLATLLSHAADGEEYDLYIDLHRDAFADTGEPNVVMTSAGPAARIMFLIGRGDSFAIKPHTDVNLAFANSVTRSINAAEPDLCRDVLEKGNRYNQHMGSRAVLIEVGNNENTIDEALRAVPALSAAIAEALWQPDSVPEPTDEGIALLSASADYAAP